MATYQMQVNERTLLGKNLIALLQSVPQVVTLEKPERKSAPPSELYKSLNRAFADVRLMIDGKKKEKTLQELIDELPDSND